jgi:hypothetical protein
MITAATHESAPGVVFERFSLRTDPFTVVSRPERRGARAATRMRSGAFFGAEGAVLIAPLTIARPRAAKRRLLLLLSGDASASRLPRIAGSMKRWAPAGRADPPRDDPSPGRPGGSRGAPERRGR